MKSSRTYLTLVMESLNHSRDLRIVEIGSFSRTKVHEFQNKGQHSTLWQQITQIMSEQYPNDRLTEIKARGGLTQDWEADFTAPDLKRPAVVGYGPCAGILVSEVWS